MKENIPLVDDVTRARVRQEVDTASAARADAFKAMGFVLIEGEWRDGRTKRLMDNDELTTIYKMMDDNAGREPGDARWPWPSRVPPI